ncbi:MAG: HupE/UreJ family protein [Betaproteobacteria bacterium]
MRIAIALLLLISAHFAWAHKPSDSYLTLMSTDSAVDGRWDIALRDLDYALGLDADQDGAITWGELRARHDDIAAYALARLKLDADGTACATRMIRHEIDDHSDGAYAVLRFRADCSHQPVALNIDYRLFFDLDAQHKGLLGLTQGGATQSVIFAADAPRRHIAIGAPDHWREFGDYLRNGVWHIWIGFDHILFLLSLLLPAVLLRRDRRWQAGESFAAAFREVAKVVTAFTVAHSITLSIAALGVVSPPSRWVESAIAASVVLAALNNIRPVVTGRRWIMAFVFGLVHGFGFAAVLVDLGLPKANLLIALVAFNGGVELGQLAIVTAFLPVAWWLRQGLFYRRVVFMAGSIAVAAIAAAWLIERAFDVRLVA